MLPPLDPINLLESSMAEDASPRTQNLKKVAERQPGLDSGQRPEDWKVSTFGKE